MSNGKVMLIHLRVGLIKNDGVFLAQKGSGFLNF